MNTLFHALRFALLAVLLVDRADAQEPAVPAGFRSLFNGKDLSGWHGLNPHGPDKLTGEALKANLAKQREEFPNHWRVEDGALVNDGHGPYATTDEELGDFELMVEYKTVGGADSGIYLRGNPQVQIWDWHQPDHPKNPDRRPRLGSGGLFNNTARTLGRDPSLFADKPLGEWNSFKIRLIGNRAWVWLNTRAVVEGAVMENYWDRSKPLAARGPIMLQTHGGEIRWRNICMREIGEGEAQRLLAANPPIPNPTGYDVSYGPHPSQVLHFWKAESSTPTPVLFFIHGGGWRGGGRMSGATSLIPTMLAAGISVASVEYRFIGESTDDQVLPPVKVPLHDAAQALQFLRRKSAEWNIDKARIGASGGSAGACSSLWLAFHPDLADAKSDDPIARESSRLWCAAVTGAQTTLDPGQMKEWTPNSSYGGHAFGFKGDPTRKLSAFDEFLGKRESILPWIAEYSPYALVSGDDPPIGLYYGAAPALGQPQRDPTHTSNFGVKLQERCRELKVECELVYPGAPDVKHATVADYLLDRLKR